MLIARRGEPGGVRDRNPPASECAKRARNLPPWCILYANSAILKRGRGANSHWRRLIGPPRLDFVDPPELRRPFRRHRFMTRWRQALVKTTHGTVHGRTIELDEDLGLAEGQAVEIQVKVIPQPTQWGDGLRRCAGALANEWTEEDDRILEGIHRDRKQWQLL
jgi:hypothetical protein